MLSAVGRTSPSAAHVLNDDGHLPACTEINDGLEAGYGAEWSGRTRADSLPRTLARALLLLSFGYRC